MKTIYEWDIETVDKHGDIHDHYHEDTLPAMLKQVERWGPTEGEWYRLVLVGDVWDDCGSLDDRQWW